MGQSLSCWFCIKLYKQMHGLRMRIIDAIEVEYRMNKRDKHYFAHHSNGIWRPWQSPKLQRLWALQSLHPQLVTLPTKFLSALHHHLPSPWLLKWQQLKCACEKRITSDFQHNLNITAKCKHRRRSVDCGDSFSVPLQYRICLAKNWYRMCDVKRSQH
jgi:hypothetical protein